MASFTASYIQSGTVPDGRSSFSGAAASSEVSYTITSSSSTLNVGDTVTITSGDTVKTGTYLGYTNIGLVIGNVYYPSSERWNASYFTTESVARGASPFTSGSYNLPCFLSGTLIACPDGDRRVEDLAVGDLVLTVSGEARPLRWIGRRTMVRGFADPAMTFPIRIRAGALGGGQPRRDLHVAPTHAMLFAGVLVQAAVLVNGSTIAQVAPRDERFTYHHLEFAAHELVLAEGAPSESYVDSNDSRRRFDNHAEFAALYGTDAPVAEPSALPRVTASRQMPRRLTARLAEITASLHPADAASDAA